MIAFVRLLTRAVLCWSALGLAWGATTDYEAGLARLREGRPAEALPLLESALRQEPQNADVLYNLAGCYFALNRTEDGVRIAGELARQNRKDPAVLLAAGTLMSERAPGRAAEVLASADAIAPGNPLVLSALASAEYRGGDSNAAVATLERLLANLRTTSSAETRSTLASAAQTAHALSAGSPSLRIGLLAAELDLLGDRPREALEVLTPLAGAGKGTPEYFKLLGLANARLNRLPEAILAHREAVRLAPQNEDLLLTLAADYQKSRDNAAAIRLLEGALGRGVVSPEIYFALALSEFNFAAFERAVAHCNRALALDPKFDRAALLAGRASVKLSRPKQAETWLRRSLEIDPVCEYCKYELASVLAGENRFAEAEPLLREVVARRPSNASAQFELGKLLEARGDTAGALAALKAAVAADAGRDDAWYRIARLQLRQGNRIEAEQSMATVKQIKERRRTAAQDHLTGDHP